MKILALGMTMGALALATLGAQAQTTDNSSTGTGTAGTGTMGSGDMSGSTTTGTGAMTGTMGSNSMMMGGATMAPTPVTGTVTRYYVDRAGFVSAMDVQTADGTKMVQFSPSMAQRLTSSFPVGSTINGFVTSSGMGSMMSYELAGTGTSAPSPSMMMMTPMMVNDLDILRSTPYVMLGSKEMSVMGKLTGYVSDPMSGEVLALVLDNNTLVRVPPQNRVQQSTTAPEGVRDLLRGALITARGMGEAPRYGVVSPFSRRIVASGISVDGRTLGTFGFGLVPTKRSNGLVQFGRRGGSTMNMDYMPYMTPGSDASMGMSGGAMTGGATGDTMSGGTGGAATGGAMNGTGAGTTTPAS